jgi:hypothetical protein
MFEGKLLVYRNEPLLHSLTKLGLGSVQIGLGFFILITLPLTLWAIVFDSSIEIDARDYVSYLENISWSLSLIYIFPFIVGLIHKYYKEIPRLYDRLIKNSINPLNETAVAGFRVRVDRRFNQYMPQVVIITITLIMNGIYFYQIISKTGAKPDWMTVGTVFQDTLSTVNGMTTIGIAAGCVQIVLTYWVLSFIYKSFVFAWSLYVFFADRQLDIQLDPLHFDGVCGLRRIAYMSTLQAVILFLLGIYLSLKAIDTSLIQEISIFSDIGNPLMLGSYALLAPLMFFLPMASAHNLMQETKDSFLQRFTEKTGQMIEEADRIDDVYESAEYLHLAKDLEKLHSKFNNKIPGWPFNVRTIQGFFGSVLVPLVPVLIPVIFNIL